MDTTEMRSIARFLWAILFYGWYFLITMLFAYICYSHIIIYTIRGGIENIVTVAFILVFYLPVSAKLKPYRYKRDKDDLLSGLMAFLSIGYIIITTSVEAIGLKLYLLSVVLFCVTGYWLAMGLRKLKSHEVPEQ